GEVVDHDSDHQPEREQRVHQRLAPFGLLLAEMSIDVQRLRVERHVREQHVVHLRYRPRERMLVEMADREVVEIDAATLVATQFGVLSHRVSPIACGAGGCRTMTPAPGNGDESLGRWRCPVQPTTAFPPCSGLRYHHPSRGARI